MNGVEEAGAIAVTLHDGEPRKLLVTAKQNSDEWIFPKGHLDPGETPDQAALRELREEAGFEGIILQQAGSYEFVQNGERIIATYFLVEASPKRVNGENRQIKWCTYDEALRQLTYADAKRLLTEQVIPAIESIKRDS
jgi:8-oxo-dGTP pyrophosphatase MutT (NUDIX family)